MLSSGLQRVADQQERVQLFLDKVWEPGRSCRHCPKGQRPESATHSGCFPSPWLPLTQGNGYLTLPNRSSLWLGMALPPSSLSRQQSSAFILCIRSGWVHWELVVWNNLCFSREPCVIMGISVLSPKEGPWFVQVFRYCGCPELHSELYQVVIRLMFLNASQDRGCI